jgi:hypothetical protein
MALSFQHVLYPEVDADCSSLGSTSHACLFQTIRKQRPPFHALRKADTACRMDWTAYRRALSVADGRGPNTVVPMRRDGDHSFCTTACSFCGFIDASTTAFEVCVFANDGLRSRATCNGRKQFILAMKEVCAIFPTIYDLY